VSSIEHNGGDPPMSVSLSYITSALCAIVQTSKVQVNKSKRYLQL